MMEEAVMGTHQAAGEAIPATEAMTIQAVAILAVAQEETLRQAIPAFLRAAAVAAGEARDQAAVVRRDEPDLQSNGRL